MQREEKQLENFLDTAILRLNDLKNTIGSMIHKLETEGEQMNYPTFLDNFAVISGHLTGLSKLLGHEMSPPLRNLTVLPLHLSMDRDESLLQLTEGRIPQFAHDICPDYLRTKSEPAAENRIVIHESKAANLMNDTAGKLAAQYNKVISHVYDLISKAKEEWEIEASSRAGIHQTNSLSDTHALVAAVGIGKGLKVMNMGPQPGNMMIPPTQIPSQIRPPPVQMSSVSPGVGQIGKLPSAIKTNIKSAQLHPYR